MNRIYSYSGNLLKSESRSKLFLLISKIKSKIDFIELLIMKGAEIKFKKKHSQLYRDISMYMCTFIPATYLLVAKNM